MSSRLSRGCPAARATPPRRPAPSRTTARPAVTRIRSPPRKPGQGRAETSLSPCKTAPPTRPASPSASSPRSSPPARPRGRPGGRGPATSAQRSVENHHASEASGFSTAFKEKLKDDCSRIEDTRTEGAAVTEPSQDLPELSPAEAKERLEQALFEIRRVIAGQDVMLERVVVCLLAQGHLLLEGVPGLAKTLTIKTTAAVLGGSFSRIQFTPDLVPSDLVGTRIYRPGEGVFDTELGPVFCNFLLADEINRAPAKVQSALLEVMQERQVTIGNTTYPVPEPFLAMATQNPIESEGTYPLPEAQVDRFMLKVLIGYPEHDEELTIVQRQLVAAPELREALTLDDLRALQRSVFAVYVDPALVSYAVSLATATRDPAAHGLANLGEMIAFGASPRGPGPATCRTRCCAPSTSRSPTGWRECSRATTARRCMVTGPSSCRSGRTFPATTSAGSTGT